MPDRDKEVAVRLLEAVQRQVKQIQTKSLDLSFNELLDMYRDQELEIDPEYQRAFRWSEGKESRFIESLILGMPIPPIFVIELDDGKFELIDGLQRLSSYFHFRGSLNLDGFDRRISEGDELVLRDCDIVADLNGLTHTTLPVAMQIRLKRHFIRVEVIGRDSDQRLRYHMFKRLNTGGENLSEQEVRNCTVRLLSDGDRFMKYIIALSDNEDFRRCTETLSDEARQKRFDQELVLRFFAFKNNRDEYTHDVADFLTDFMEKVSDPEADSGFDYGRERETFERTFRILSATLGDRAFGWVNKSGNIVRGFAVYHFEAFTLGIQPFLDRINPEDPEEVDRVNKLLEEIKGDEDFREVTTGGGRNSRGALARRVDFVTHKLAEAFEQ